MTQVSFQNRHFKKFFLRKSEKIVKIEKLFQKRHLTIISPYFLISDKKKSFELYLH